MTRNVLVTMCLVVVAACSTTGNESAIVAWEPPVADYVPPVQQEPALPKVTVPVSAPWLADAIETTYRDLPADQALQLLVPSGAVRLHVTRAGPPVGNPLVNAVRTATTRQQHIDSVCSQADWAWRIDRGVLVVTDVITKTFQLNVPPGTVTYQLEPGRLDTDNAAAEPDAAQEFVSNAHEQLLEAMETVLAGGEVERPVPTRLAVVGASGQVVVTGAPSQVAEVEALVVDYNERMNRRVSLEFVLFEVDVTDTETRSLDISALFASARLATLSGAVEISPLGASTTDDATAGELSLRFDGGGDDVADLVFQWLQEQGNTSVSVRKKVVAVHNQIATLRDVETIRYVGKVAIERDVSGSSEVRSPTIDIEALVTGEAWAVLPTIDADRVVLRLAMDRGDLLGFTTYSYSGGAIAGALPQSAMTSVGLPISLADGETRLITNLSSTTTSQTAASTPLLSWLPWLGSLSSGKDEQERRLESVIAMTAHIL